MKSLEGQRTKVLARIDRINRQADEAVLRITTQQAVSDELQKCITAEAEMLAQRIRLEKALEDIGLPDLQEDYSYDKD